MTRSRKKGRGDNHGKTIIVDTNLMLLLITGLYNPAIIARYKRVNKYSIQDYNLLYRNLTLFQSKLTTPHILTEVSNFLLQIEGPYKIALFKVFASLIATLEEIHVPAKLETNKPHFVQFGLTDLGMIEAAGSTHAILTADGRLAAYARSQGADAIDFEDCR